MCMCRHIHTKQIIIRFVEVIIVRFNSVAIRFVFIFFFNSISIYAFFRPFIRVDSTFFVMSCVTTYPEKWSTLLTMIPEGQCGTLSLLLLCLRLRKISLQKPMILFLWPFKWTTLQVQYIKDSM